MDTTHTVYDPQRTAEIIRRYRQRKGLSVGQAAEAIGVTRQTLHQLESGTARPNSTTIAAIASALGIAPGRLFRRVA